MGKIRIVHVVNRTCEHLESMWDGCQERIPPGYLVGEDGEVRGAEVDWDGKPTGKPHRHPMEFYAAEKAKGQHPIFGTQDPFILDAHATEYKIGIVEWGDPIDFVEIDPDVAELLDRSKLGDGDTAVLVRPTMDGRGVKAISPKEAREAEARSRRSRRLAHTDASLSNPMGQKLHSP